MNPKYRAYLQSPEWRKKRGKIIKRDGYKCRYCKSTKKLQVHHLTYKRIYKEKDKDLVTLCSKCHRRIHKHYTFEEKVLLFLAKTGFFTVLTAVLLILVRKYLIV